MTGQITNSKLMCPKCGTILDGFTGINHEDKPSDGDLSVCFYCMNILRYTKNLTDLKLLTNEELLVLQKEEPEVFGNLKEAIQTIYLMNRKK